MEDKCNTICHNCFARLLTTTCNPNLTFKIEYDQDYFCVVNIMRIAQSYYQLLSMVCHSPYINYTI